MQYVMIFQYIVVTIHVMKYYYQIYSYILNL